MVWNASADPVVRRLSFKVKGWPAGAPPMRLVLLSDVHVAGPDNPPARVARIVAQVNAHKPDLVLIAGDFVSEKRMATQWFDAPAAIAPLGALRARHGVIAVLGNHDHWFGAKRVRVALAAAGIRVIDNGAERVGPLAIGGVDDDFTDHARLPEALSALREAKGIPVLLSHSPDVVPEVPDWVPLILAGHTHCGQIVLPWYGAIATASRSGERFRCGVVRAGAHTVIVTAGIGTSILPFRLGAPSDYWIIDIGQSPA
ncbi:MAG: metallophosphoesterase [Sphingomonas sp.]|nr:metallophosphoesterase [Sphingomonas sp.]